MGWGLFLTKMAWDVTKTGVKTSAAAGKHLSKKISEHHNKNRIQEENRLNRNVMVDSDLIGHSWLGLNESSELLSLEKEATPIHCQTMLPANGQRAFHNTVISGGTSFYRAQAVLKVCEDAYMGDQAVILIHCNNREIEQKICSSTVIQDQLTINAANSCYDPFFDLTPSELADRFIHTGPESIRHNWQFAVLTELIAELYLIRKRKTISLKTLLQFPVTKLPDKILDTRNAGLIDDTQMLAMNQRYQSAQSQIWHLQQYFNRLKTDLYAFYRYHKGSFQDIGHALANKKTVMIDVLDSRNTVLVKMLFADLKHLQAKGIRFVTCLCDLPLSSCDGDQEDLILKGGQPFLVSTADVVSSAGEKLNPLLGYAEDRIYFKHSDGRHADILSEDLGTFKRWCSGYNFSSTRRGLTSDYTSGINITEDPAARRIPPEIIQDLKEDQMIYREGDSNSIFILRCGCM